MSIPATNTHIAELRIDLRERLEHLYRGRFKEAVLFGSHARGEAHSGSDLDVIVVLRGPVDPYLEAHRLNRVIFDLLAQYAVFVSPVVLSEEEFRASDWPLLTNVGAEGAPL